MVDSEVGTAAVTSDNPSLHQEGISGTPIAWGGTHSTRQVTTLQPETKVISILCSKYLTLAFSLHVIIVLQY